MIYKSRRISSFKSVCAKLSAILMLVLVASCASKQVTTQFYTMQAVASEQEAVKGSVGLAKANIRISDVSTAAFLAQTGIITADADGMIYPANYHLWAELPEVAIKRRLERCFLQDTNSERKPLLIGLEVHSFQGDGDGGVVFGGVWTSASQSTRADKDTFLFEYRERQIGDGYGPLVAALSQTVQQLCVDILDEV